MRRRKQQRRRLLFPIWEKAMPMQKTCEKLESGTEEYAEQFIRSLQEGMEKYQKVQELELEVKRSY